MPPAIDTVAHIIQIALTPIFLLVGVAGLLNVFSTRHSYVTQHVDQTLDTINDRAALDNAHIRIQLENLSRRSKLLDVAVVLGVLSGCLTSLAAIVLFVSELGDEKARYVLFAIFGGALSCTVAALAVFSVEMIMSGQGVRRKIRWAEEDLAKAPGERR